MIDTGQIWVTGYSQPSLALDSQLVAPTCPIVQSGSEWDFCVSVTFIHLLISTLHVMLWEIQGGCKFSETLPMEEVSALPLLFNQSCLCDCLTSRIQQKGCCASFQAGTFSCLLFVALACGIQLPCCEEVRAAPQRGPHRGESRLLAIPPAGLLA